MTRTAGKGKKALKGAKKLSLKKETVKDLDAGSGKTKELGDDQLDGVNGGIAGPKPTLPCGERPHALTAPRFCVERKPTQGQDVCIYG